MGERRAFPDRARRAGMSAREKDSALKHAGSGEAMEARWRQAIEDPEGHFFGLTKEPIDGRGLMKKMLRGEDGAVVTFEGVARNHSHWRRTLGLEYDCYEPMAIEVMARVGREIAAAHPIGR